MKCRFFILARTMPLLVACAATGLSMATPAHADERFFTYLQDADVLPRGASEFEQWLTFGKGHPEGDRDYDLYRWDFREEIEHGFTDRLSAALYLNFRQETTLARVQGLPDSSEFSFKGVSGELKYRLLNPNTDPVGVALYFEPTFSGAATELEYKLIFSKNLGDKWVLAANINIEQEWEREEGLTKKESVLEYLLGAAYRVTPNWSVGLEARQHTVCEGLSFNERLGTAWFLGPNIHYGSGKWWATFTALPQIAGHPADAGLNLTEHQRFEARLITGINF
jgi:hypothetical protein